MNTITKQNIIDGLKELGVAEGQKILMHSSLSSLGHVEGGATTVIEAVLSAIGSTGTLLVPTITVGIKETAATLPVFDPANSPGWTGVIPETFRKRSDAIRSLHPTHSVAAIGVDAKRLTEEHIASIMPCDDLSPYGKLAALEDSYILLVGVDHESSTMFHHVEELAGDQTRFQPGFARAKIIVNGQQIIRHMILHQYGTPTNFNIMEPIFLERGIQKNTQIGQATIRFVHVKKMVQATLLSMRAHPRILKGRYSPEYLLDMENNFGIRYRD